MQSPSVDRVGYLLPTQDEPRVRRARNAVTAVAGLLLVAGTFAGSSSPGQLQQAFGDLVTRFPGWAEWLFWSAYGAAGLFALGVVAALLTRVRTNPGAARDTLVAGVAATVASVLLMVWQQGTGPALLPELGAAEPLRQFPVVRVAVVTAVVLAAAPHLAASVRRFGIGMIVVGTLSSFGLGFGLPSDAVAAVGLGMAASGSVLLVYGSPSGFPPPQVVAGALAALGVTVDDLTLARDQSWGIRRFVGRDPDEVHVEVKAYGKDAVDTQAAATLWRALWYRGTSAGEMLTRMQAVEHEALMTLLAARAGVRTVELLAAGRAGDDVAIIAVQRPGVALPLLDPERITDRLLGDVWRDVDVIHATGMAHGALTAASVTVDEHGHLFGDFTDGTIGAGDERLLDVANLLFTTAVLVGAERAVAVARVGLGDDRLGAALPYLQLPALRREVRARAAAPGDLVEQLRTTVSRVTGVEQVEPVRLRRVSGRQLGMLALLLFSAGALVSQLADIDFAAVWAVVRDASWLLMLLALPVSHLLFQAEASAMIAAVGRPLPRRPLLLLQVATRFIGLAVPSAAGRVAMLSAFLVRFGVRPAVAVVQSGVDSLAGFVVEAAIIVAAVLLTETNPDLSRDVDWGVVLAIAVLVVAVGGVLLVSVARLRALVVPVLRDGLGSLSSVLRDPRRTIRLLGSNLSGRLVLGVTLWLVLRALGVDDVGVATALTVTVATNLLAGIAPVPGGIGVAEAVMTSWLVLVGVPEEQAVAATVVYRLWTFYIPAVEGVGAMRWLERNDYL